VLRRSALLELRLCCFRWVARKPTPHRLFEPLTCLLSSVFWRSYSIKGRASTIIKNTFSRNYVGSNDIVYAVEPARPWLANSRARWHPISPIVICSLSESFSHPPLPRIPVLDPGLLLSTPGLPRDALPLSQTRFFARMSAAAYDAMRC
jgi:hypothetical protein